MEDHDVAHCVRSLAPVGRRGCAKESVAVRKQQGLLEESGERSRKGAGGPL